VPHCRLIVGADRALKVPCEESILALLEKAFEEKGNSQQAAFYRDRREKLNKLHREIVEAAEKQSNDKPNQLLNQSKISAEVESLLSHVNDLIGQARYSDAEASLHKLIETKPDVISDFTVCGCFTGSLAYCYSKSKHKGLAHALRDQTVRLFGYDSQLNLSPQIADAYMKLSEMWKEDGNQIRAERYAAKGAQMRSQQ
jgi:hypothetical protein